MEGWLYKWTNYLYGWKRRYFVLYNGVLQYSKAQGMQRQGALHLNVAKIQPHAKNPRRFLINTGTSVLHLKANTPADALAWINALKAAQELLLQDSERQETKEYSPSSPSLVNHISHTLAQFVDCQRNLEGLILSLQPTVKAQFPEVECVRVVAEELKRLSSQALGLLEEEQGKAMRRQLEWREVPSLSMIGSLEPENEEFFDALDGEEAESEATLLRQALPAVERPARPAVWKYLRNSAGKSLDNIKLPLSLYEPLSLLQRFSEDLTYYSLLEQASSLENQYMRLAYVSCFALSSYSCTADRALRSFSPVLGETFELEREKLKLISEQVTASTAALHCDHPEFTYKASVSLSTRFTGTEIEINPSGCLSVYLKRRSEEYKWQKVTTTVHNLILGQVCVDHFGDMEVRCGDLVCKLRLSKLSWFRPAARTVEGVILDSRGVTKLRIFGTWRDHLIVKNDGNGEEMLIWERNSDLKEANNFYFSSFALQLNLPAELCTRSLPDTDSRQRADIRALENGDYKAAAIELKRVEEQEKALAHLRNTANGTYSPKWFYYEAGQWRYKGGYWELKES